MKTAPILQGCLKTGPTALQMHSGKKYWKSIKKSCNQKPPKPYFYRKKIMNTLLLLSLVILFSLNVKCQSSFESNMDTTKSERYQKGWVKLREIDGAAGQNVIQSLENILNDETQREIGVYLPPDYNNSNKKYPVLYYLMGYNSSGKNPYRKIKELKNQIDNMIYINKLCELIIVFINGSNKFRGSFYVNSPVTGNWEDFITHDVITHIDNKYRTLANKESRSIAGSSMGGYGALNLSMLHPEIYCAGFGISPGLYTDMGFNNSQIIKRKGNIENTISLIEKLNSLPKDNAKKEFFNFLDTCTNKTLFFTMAYGAAHAPNIEQPPYFNFPFKVVDNDTIVDTDIWQLWQNGFGGIDKEIELYKDNLEQLKVYGIACGYKEGNKWLIDGCYYYADKLAENRINHILYLHQGTHTSHTIDVMINNVLPLLSNVMEH